MRENAEERRKKYLFGVEIIYTIIYRPRQYALHLKFQMRNDFFKSAS